MKYAFGDYTLDTSSETLLLKGNSVELEPKQYSTLLLFCQSDNKILSRDTLLEAIWKGTIVSDNTINKHIAGIRKVLGDDAKSPKYITTVPRKGYRFIDVTIVITKDGKSAVVTLKSTKQPLFLSILLLCTLFISSVLLLNPFKKNLSSDDIVSLTRMEGHKHGITFYKDDKNIVFVNDKQQGSALYIQNLEDREITSIGHTFDTISNLASAEGIDELYVVGRKSGETWLAQCRIEQGKLVIDAELKISEFTVFDMDYMTSTEGLFLIAQTESLATRGLYFADIELTNITPLHIPDNQVLLSRVDSDRNEDQLLLLGQLPNSTSIAFSYSPDSKITTPLHEFDSYIRDIVWHKEGMLFSDTPPAQRVFFVKPNSFTKPKIVATSSEYLCCESLYSDSTQQLIYRTNTTNYQIDSLGEVTWSIDNSTVYDMLPSLFHDSAGLVFVSKRTGKSQLYYQNANGVAKQLSDFSRYRLIRAIDVSLDNSKVVSIADDSMFLHSLTTNEKTLTKTFNNRSWLVDIAWLDNKHLVLKHQNKRRSWLEVYDSELNLVRTLSSQWHQLFTDQVDRTQWFALHEQEGLVQLSSITAIKNEPLLITKNIPGSYIKRRKIVADSNFFYQLQPNNKILKQYNSEGDLIKNHSFNRLYGFDINDSKITVSERKYHSSNWHARPLSQN